MTIPRIFASMKNLPLWMILSVSTFFGVESQAEKMRSEPELKIDYRIAPQDLADALRAFAEISQVQVVYPSAIVQGKVSSGLIGGYGVLEALDILLENQSIGRQVIGDDAIVLFAKAPTVVGKPQAKPLIPVKKDAVERLETVEVTGSRLLRPQFDYLYPTITISPEYLYQISASEIGTTIESLPVACQGSYSVSGSNNERNIGSTFPDLYCLGSQRTLLLVNGHRMVSTNEVSVIGAEKGSQFDINAIPNVMLDRIEIVGVGGAPVYGADAVAGTVNILLKDEFEGAEVDVQAGISDQEDAEQLNLSFLIGDNFFQGRGHVTFAYEYHEQKAVQASDRDYTASDFTLIEDESGDEILYRDVTSLFQSATGVPSEPILGENEEFLRFNENGNLVPLVLGEFISGDQFVGGDGRRESDRWTLRLPLKRHMAVFSGALDFEDSLKFFGEFLYYQAESSARARNTVTLGLPISTEHPFLDPEDRRTILQNFTDDISEVPEEGFEFIAVKELVDITGITLESNNEIIQAVLGVNGIISAPRSNWEWEASVNQGWSYSETIDLEMYRGRFFEGAGIVEDDEGNKEACQPGLAAAPNECFDNIRFLPFGIIQDPALLRELSARPKYLAQQRQTVLDLAIRGEIDLFSAGPLSLAAGIQRRIEKAESRPDDFISQELGLFDRVEALDGGFSTKELFGEILIPVLDETSDFARSIALNKLQIESSLRRVLHSNAGGDTSWMMGSRIEFKGPMFTTIGLRGNVTKSIRAPAITELYAPRSSVALSEDLPDPCSSIFLETSEDAEILRAQCQQEASALGFADNFIDDEFVEEFISQGAIFSLGNPQLKSERAASKTWGVVLRDSSDAHGAALAIDIVDIEINDVIGQDPIAMFAKCYLDQLDKYCEMIERNPSDFSISRAEITYLNVGDWRMRSVQYSATVPFSLDKIFNTQSKLILNLQGHRFREFRLDNGQDFSGSYRVPDTTARASLNYVHDKFDISFTSLYTGKVSYANDLQLKESWLHYLSWNYYYNDHWRIRGGIKNLLDWQPENPLQSLDATGRYAPIGREYSLGLTLKY